MEHRVPEPPVDGHLEAVDLDIAALTHGQLARDVVQLVPGRRHLDALGLQHLGVVVEDGRAAEEREGEERRGRLAEIIEVRVLGLAGKEVLEIGAVGALGIGLEVLEQPRLPELRHGLADHVEDGGGGLGRRRRADLGQGLEVVALEGSLDPVLGLRLVELLDVGLGDLAILAPERVPELRHDGIRRRGPRVSHPHQPQHDRQHPPHDLPPLERVDGDALPKQAAVSSRSTSCPP